ncbi:MAG: hypothetical protein U9N42_10000 [Campylobacterota bacterium]|nr:hypothetical protein [Campylobacterota bacterium]
MFKLTTLLLISVLFVGCSQKSINYNTSAQLKAFEKEDEYILYALDSTLRDDLNASIGWYDILYEKSGKNEYLYNKLQLELLTKRFDDVISQTSKLLKIEPNHYELRRYQISAYLKKGEIEKAKELSLALVKKTEEERDFLLIADIYIAQQNYKMGFKYLTRAYTINYDEKILDKLSILMYVNLGMKAEAISQLESHALMRGCSVTTCKRLLSYYGENNNIDAMLRVANKLYDVQADKNVAKIVIDIYRYKKDSLNLEKFLEKSKSNNDMLMQLYASSKKYNKAKDIALKLYDETSSLDYLAKASIFAYEAKPNSSTLHNFVIKNLKYVISYDPKALYLNYLGYIMIEHDIEVKNGIKYVKEALKKSPDSPYYLDSLAWGYYKIKSCDKAYRIIKKVDKMLPSKENEDVKIHLKKIKECLNKDI